LPAHGQDVSGLFYIIVPPILLAPFATTLLRRAWVRRGGQISAPTREIFAMAGIEILLWLVSAVLFVIMFFNEVFYIAVVLSVATTLLVGWSLNRRLARSSSGLYPRWWETWLLLAAAPASLVGLTLITALVLLVLGF